MKKFISMVMAAAMVVSLVPATAFAAKGEVYATTDGTTKVTGALTKEENFKFSASYEAGYINLANAPEVRIELNKVLPQETDEKFEQDITITLDGAEFRDFDASAFDENDLLGLLALNGYNADTVAAKVATWNIGGGTFTATASGFDTETLDTITFTVKTTDPAIMAALKGSVITFDLCSLLTDVSAGQTNSTY